MSYDEPIVRFSGRTFGTIRAKHKTHKERIRGNDFMYPDGYEYAFYSKLPLHKCTAERLELHSLALRASFSFNETNKLIFYFSEKVPQTMPSGIASNTVVGTDNRFWDVPIMAGLGTFISNEKGNWYEFKCSIVETKMMFQEKRAGWCDLSS